MNKLRAQQQSAMNAANKALDTFNKRRGEKSKWHLL